MRSLDERVILAALYSNLDSQPKAIEVWISGMTKEDSRVHFRVFREFLLIRTRRNKLECSEETCCMGYDNNAWDVHQTLGFLRQDRLRRTGVSHGKQLFRILAVALAARDFGHG